MSVSTLSSKIINWYKKHGRFDLPWQQDRSLYRVWVSEIMLQQTQVNTVIPYFEKFITVFSSIEQLAQATQDEVLHHWTGLGYYARGRNLHKAAQIIMQQHNGQFPTEFEPVLALPGIGRSTAAAILAQALNQSHAILDGNVKRVLARYHVVAGWYGNKANSETLWQLSEQHTPKNNCADYTQAIMDLGATLCTRSKPACDICPLNKHCKAFAQGNPSDYPGKKPKKNYPIKSTTMMILEQDGKILLYQRPPAGIWGSLWSFPECPSDAEPTQWCQENLGLSINTPKTLSPIQHKFSHYQLDINPQLAQIAPQNSSSVIMENQPYVWYNTRQPDAIGLPAPVKSLIETLFSTH
ncbi:A/G-specific adenine glycosylase [hydrothermal vent metagenome]|uniref:Adenine DNA glycosylase n=1 Tax=hydrothermal vent metagenome TaxID=652676 RepID=A0A3B1A7I1_9ZZZZ